MLSHSSKAGCRSRKSTVTNNFPYKHTTMIVVYCSVFCPAMLLKTSWCLRIETLSPPSSIRNIMFICFYATSSCLCHLYSFLLHLWRFCMMYGIWPSVLSSRIENKHLIFPLLETPNVGRHDSFLFLFFILLWCLLCLSCLISWKWLI